MLVEHHYNDDTILHEHGLVPLACYFVLNGELTLHRRDGVIEHYSAGQLVGLKELWHHLPLDSDIHAEPNSTLLMIDRSMLRKLHEVLVNPIG